MKLHPSHCSWEAWVDAVHFAQASRLFGASWADGLSMLRARHPVVAETTLLAAATAREQLLGVHGNTKQRPANENSGKVSCWSNCRSQSERCCAPQRAWPCPQPPLVS